MSKNVKVKNRGRHQAQGADIPQNGNTVSVPWAQTTDYTVAMGRQDMDKLEGQLTKAQAEARSLGFALARMFIGNAHAGGGVGPTSQHFPDYKYGEDDDIRVDLHVTSGLAFV